jgi:hypothetical protein
MCWRTWDKYLAAKERWLALPWRERASPHGLKRFTLLIVRFGAFLWARVRSSWPLLKLLGKLPSIFDDIDHTTSGAASRISSAFNYLNSSNRIEASRVRALVDDLFHRYPKAHQKSLKHRLRSIDNITHYSAFFELLLHEILTYSGYKIVAVEPDVPGTNNKPDFLVQAPAGQQFYLEATLATGRSTADAAAQTRLNQALHIIDSMGSADYFLDLSISGVPSDNIPAGKIRRRLKAWLRQLNYDRVAAGWEHGLEAVPSFDYAIHGVEFHIRPYPRRGTRGDPNERAIGIQTLEPFVGIPELPIRAAIMGKAGRYGDLQLPYIVAVNSMGIYAREDHVVDALFGSPAIEVYQTDDGPRHRNVRSRDGAWYGAGGPTYTRVSAVISTERVDPWHVGLRRARLIRNPWAARPEAFNCLTIDRREVTNQVLVETRGAALSELLELPENWPE